MKTFILLLILIFSTPNLCWSQTSSTLTDHPVTIAAPHLPPMLRHDGTGKPIYGDKYAYKRDENITQLRNWSRDYPDEVTKYREAIQDYLNSTNVDLLSALDKELYHDLKSQWLIFSQL